MAHRSYRASCLQLLQNHLLEGTETGVAKFVAVIVRKNATGRSGQWVEPITHNACSSSQVPQRDPPHATSRPAGQPEGPSPGHFVRSGYRSAGVRVSNSSIEETSNSKGSSPRPGTAPTSWTKSYPATSSSVRDGSSSKYRSGGTGLARWKTFGHEWERTRSRWGSAG